MEHFKLQGGSARRIVPGGQSLIVRNSFFHGYIHCGHGGRDDDGVCRFFSVNTIYASVFVSEYRMDGNVLHMRYGRFGRTFKKNELAGMFLDSGKHVALILSNDDEGRIRIYPPGYWPLGWSDIAMGVVL